MGHPMTAPTPHIEARVGDIAETILLPGDPLRAQFIADTYLKDVRLFNQVRGMPGYTGTYNGKPVSVMGTGMGCPSMGIYSHELIHIYGVKNLVRIGTSGSKQPFVKPREMVFGMAASYASDYVDGMGPARKFHYSPCCDYGLLERAVAYAREKDFKFHVGNLCCRDCFYGDDLVSFGKDYTQMGILACEMESAALYTNAAMAGAKALCIVTISEGPGEVTTAQERQTAFTQMMEVALSLA